MRCTICGDNIDPESPLAIRMINPLTFRWAWMELWCLRMAIEDLSANEKERYTDKLAADA